jgi:EAL domain-containing protein (putative c-di-GMP-specific phosphodiesterase class I)
MSGAMLALQAVRRAMDTVTDLPVLERPRRGADVLARVQHQRSMAADLRLALRRGALTMHYQPRLRLSDGKVMGAEGLLRWRHRRHGNVPPSVFIPVAERSALIVEIGGWVLQEAAREAASWPGLGTVAVNVSARQLTDGALLTQVASALELSGLEPERLELELTETMLLDGGLDTLLTLSAVRDLGVGLALDDFGTGFASLAMLRRLPLTAMKLDRSFVRDLPHDREDAAIVRAVIGSGHALGLTVVAEGIETAAQNRFLTDLGCDEGQGYLFGHPGPAEALRARLAAA